jgi:hypothetical protein
VVVQVDDSLSFPYRQLAISPVPITPCAVAPEERWTKAESFVWLRACAGQIADFNEGKEYGGNLDPWTQGGLPASRTLTSKFLSTILLDDKYRKRLAPRGVHIIGARFDERLEMRYAKIEHELRLEYSLLKDGMDFSWARFERTIAVDRSNFLGPVNMFGIQTGDNLFLRYSTFAEGIDLGSARIGSRLSFWDSSVAGSLDMGYLQTGENLQMRWAKFEDVGLSYSRIGGQLHLHGAKVLGKFEAEFAEVRLGIYLRNNAEFYGPLRLDFAKMALVELAGGIFHKEVNLTGAQISGELRIGVTQGGESRYAQWPDKDHSILILRNAKSDAIQDLRSAWPPQIDLNGFVYRGLGGILAGQVDVMADRPPDWFTTEWLGKPVYTQQPYEQLASVLRNYGRQEAANDILYAGRERERFETGCSLYSWLASVCLLTLKTECDPRRSSIWRFVWLTALSRTIGYGYYLWRSLYFAAFFVLLGAAVIWLWDRPWWRWDREWWLWRRSWRLPAFPVAYSFDMLLPIVKLDERHYTIDLPRCPRWYFYVHKIAGYVLASFLIAGLAGLAK